MPRKLHTLRLFVFAVLLSVCVAATASRSMKTKYTALVGRVEGMSSARILGMAEGYEAAGRREEALVLYTVVCNRASDGMSEDERKQCSLAYSKASNAYFELGNYVSALEVGVKGLKVSEQLEDSTYAALVYNNIGNVYGVFLDYEKALNYYVKAYSMLGKSAKRKSRYNILANITGMYTFLGKTRQAMKYYRLSEKVKDPHNPVNVFMSSYMYGLIRRYEGHFTESADRFKRLAGYAKGSGIAPKYVCFAYQETYSSYLGLGKRDSVLKYLRLCDEAARRNNIQHMFAETQLEFSKLYEAKGDVATANMYKARYLNLKDSIYNAREFDIVKNTQFLYELDKTTKEIQAARQREAEKAETIRRLWIVIGIVVLFSAVVGAFLFVVYRQKRNLNRSYQDLYQLNRSFIDKQREMAERHAKDREAMKEKDRQIAMLQEKAAKAEATQPTAGQPEAKPEKYLTSNLNEEQGQQIAEAITNIMENTQEFCSTEFTIDVLARLVGSNKKYVSQVINDTFGKNFNSYINTYRVHLACTRLDDVAHFGNISLKGISEGVGFKSHTSFVNVFRKITGITPSMYQSLARKEYFATH